MKKLLIIPMAVFEIVFWVIAAFILIINISLGKRFLNWAIETLPDKDWYS